jgi:hypothetical protein
VLREVTHLLGHRSLDVRIRNVLRESRVELQHGLFFSARTHLCVLCKGDGACTTCWCWPCCWMSASEACRGVKHLLAALFAEIKHRHTALFSPSHRCTCGVWSAAFVIRAQPLPPSIQPPCVTHPLACAHSRTRIAHPLATDAADVTCSFPCALQRLIRARCHLPHLM